MTKAKIIVAGGGFGGVRAALDLAHRLGQQAEIILIDKNSYHLFCPSLYKVATACSSAKDPLSVELRRAVSVPFRDIFSGTGVMLVQAAIERVNFARQTVGAHSGQSWQYDFLILGPGSGAADYGIPGVLEYAYLFKTIDEALMANQRLNFIFDEARHGKRVMPLHIVVCGGGFTGVELAAELAVCAAKLAKICDLEKHCFYVTIVESGKVLKLLIGPEQEIARDRLTALGVAIMEGVRVEKIREDAVTLSDGHTLKSDMTVWATGTKTNPILQAIPDLELTDRGKMAVDEHLRIKRHPNVFAVGDAVELIDKRTGMPEAAMAHAAIRHGSVVASNVIRTMRGASLKRYTPQSQVWVASVGGKFALAHLWGGGTIKGFLGWMIRGMIDFKYFISILPFSKALTLFWHQAHKLARNN